MGPNQTLTGNFSIDQIVQSDVYFKKSSSDQLKYMDTDSFSFITFSLNNINGIAGSSSNSGLWYTNDGGITWNQSSVIGSNFATGCISNNNKVMIAGSSSNLGLWCSYDLGVTWIQTYSSGYFGAISISDYNNYIIASSVGIIYSTNLGQTWNNTNVPTILGFYSIIHVMPEPLLTTEEYVLASDNSQQEGGQIWRSADRGKTWSVCLGSCGYCILYKNFGDYPYVFSYNKHSDVHGFRINKSINYGSTWSSTNLNINGETALPYSLTVKSMAFDKGRLYGIITTWGPDVNNPVYSYYIQQGNIWYTTDGGNNWNRTSTTTIAGNRFNSVYMSDDGTKAFAGSGSNKGIWYSSDKGITWSQPFSEYMTGNYTNITSKSNNSSFFIWNNTTSGIIYKIHTETNFNKSMTKVINGEFKSVSLSSNGKTSISINNLNELWYSINNGDTWKKGEINITGDFKIYISDDGMNAILGSKSDKGIWYSTDRGQTWTQSSTNTTGSFNSIAMSSDGQKLIAGSNSNTGIWYSSNSGQTWTRSSWTIRDYDYEKDEPIETVLNTDGNFSSVALSSDGTRAIAGSISEKSVWYSTDEGQTWEPSRRYAESYNANTDSNFNTVAISSDGTTAVVGSGSNEGLWYSTNGGQNFNNSNIPINSKLSNILNGKTKLNFTNISSISISSNGIVLIGSASNLGILYSTDGGITVNQPSTNFSDNIDNVILSKNGINAVVLARNLGLWYSTDGCQSWTTLSNYEKTNIMTRLSGTFFNSSLNSMSSNSDCLRIVIGSNSNSTYTTPTNYGLLYLDIVKETRKLIMTDNYSIGFFNKTPSAQVTTSISEEIITENNTNINSQIIINDNTRIGGYNIKQIVSALKKYGLLA